MSDIVPRSNQQASQLTKLPAITDAVLPAIDALARALGIPREVLASGEDVTYAWAALPRELSQIPMPTNGELIARMCVAVSVGLFDGAINYAWNASMLRLKEKTKNFGLPVVAQILQKDFEEKDLQNLQDSQLLDLCLKLNLITEDGYFLLDQNRNIRNNFSAAHPTIGKINDREFITFLNRCVNYALADSASPKGVDIGAFISALKGARFTDGQCTIWVERLEATHDAQRELLFGMVHGIYCDPSTPEPARLNALELCTSYKDKFTAAIHSNLITRHSEYLAKGDSKRHLASQQLFEKLELLSLLNESERHSVISKAIDRLWNVHQEFNNFYNEPPFAERLEQLSKQGSIPGTIQEKYVQSVIGCYIGNGYGVSREAVPYYESMIRGFSPREIAFMVQLHRSSPAISRRMQDSSCRKRMRKALGLIEAASVPNACRSDYEGLLQLLQ